MDYEFLIRAGAVVAASVLAAPRLVAAVRGAASLVPTAAKENATQDSLTKDAHTVLEIAQRLRAAGLNKGVDLCKQLLDVMIGGAK
jgi:hypothetical protein